MKRLICSFAFRTRTAHAFLAQGSHFNPFLIPFLYPISFCNICLESWARVSNLKESSLCTLPFSVVWKDLASLVFGASLGDVFTQFFQLRKSQRACLLFVFFFKNFIYFFLDRGEGREKERDININVWLPLECPLLGTWHTTQACALMGNRTWDPLVRQPALNPLNHTSQG